MGIFKIDGLSLGISNGTTLFPKGQHCHDEYEFIMPKSNALYTKVEKKVICTEKQKMLPINTGQSHGPAEDAQVDGFICMSCEREYMQEISDSVFSSTNINFQNRPFDVKSDLMVLFSFFAEESLGKQIGYQFLQENLANMILAYIFRNANSNMLEPDILNKNHDSKKIKKVELFLREQYNSEFSLGEVARIAGLSPYHFIRIFKVQTGKTPYEFLLDVRIDKAKEFLLLKEKNVTDVCISCGFNNPSHFSSIFRKRVGISPTEYRRIYLQSI